MVYLVVNLCGLLALELMMKSGMYRDVIPSMHVVVIVDAFVSGTFDSLKVKLLVSFEVIHHIYLSNLLLKMALSFGKTKRKG